MFYELPLLVHKSTAARQFEARNQGSAIQSIVFQVVGPKKAI